MSKIVKLRDGNELTECKGCGRSWEIVKHASLGRCRGCARMTQHIEGKKPEKWSKEFDHCQNNECPNTKDGITLQPHNAEGLCRSCYSTKQRYIDLEHSHQVEAARRTRDGCQEKQKVHHDNYYVENREECIRNAVLYGQEHIEWRREQDAKYREANREKCREAIRKYWYANLEQEHQKRREWRQNNVEVVRQYGRNRRARMAGAEGSHTLQEWLQCVEDHEFQCYHCHCPLTEGNPPTPDHLVPIIKGGSHFISNIGPLCGECNSSKCDKDLVEFDPRYYAMRFRKKEE